MDKAIVTMSEGCMDDSLTGRETKVIRAALQEEYSRFQSNGSKDMKDVYKVYVKLFGNSCLACLAPMKKQASTIRRGKSVPIWVCSPECMGG